MPDTAPVNHEYDAIPPRILGALKRYVEERLPPGGFLYSVLKNDLFAAVAHADTQSMAGLHLLMIFLHCEVPAHCWGTPEKVHAWLDRRDGTTTNVVVEWPPHTTG